MMSGPVVRAKILIPRALRDYQRQAVLAAFKARRGMVVLPTGTGKTLVGSTLAYNYAYVLGRRVAILVPTKVLAEQWAKHFERWWRVKVGVVHSEKREPGLITVWVYNSFVRAAEVALRPLAEVIIVDEAHHAGAKMLMAALKAHVGAKIIGLTATPSRWESEGELLAFLPVLYHMSPEAAVNARALVTLEVKPVPVDLEPNLARDYDVLDTEIRRLFKMIEREENTAELRERIVRLVQRRKILAAMSPRKIRVAVELIRRLAVTRDRVLVFTESSEVAERVARETGGAVILSKTPRRERERILAEWGRRFNVLVTCRVLEEGFDVPECATGVVIATGTGERQLIQRAGRLLRPAPGKGRAVLYFVYARGTHEERALRKLQRLFNRERLDRFF